VLNGEVGESTTFAFDQRHVLYGKLRPYLNKVALPRFEGRSSTEFIPLLPHPGISREFLALLLRRPETVRAVMAANTGSRMPRTDMKVLLNLKISLPGAAERERIVDILNRANGIGGLRREALDKSHQLVPALFVSMFGDQ
jgi:type I restriction enzyme S subunit